MEVWNWPIFAEVYIYSNAESSDNTYRIFRKFLGEKYIRSARSVTHTPWKAATPLCHDDDDDDDGGDDFSASHCNPFYFFYLY